MSKPILKNVVISWYGEITLKILKEKPIKSIKKPIYIPIGHKKKEMISKRLLKTRSNFGPLKNS
jgi:hypothetical protein